MNLKGIFLKTPVHYDLISLISGFQIILGFIYFTIFIDSKPVTGISALAMA
jgi:hypothetical protein